MISLLNEENYVKIKRLLLILFLVFFNILAVISIINTPSGTSSFAQSSVGDANQPCKSDGTCNSQNLVCSSNTCRLCGNAGEPCCGGNSCTSGLTCGGGVCSSSGNSTKKANNEFCSGNSECISNFCTRRPDGTGMCTATACGSTGQACCYGSAGSGVCSGGSCNTSTGLCQAGTTPGGGSPGLTPRPSGSQNNANCNRYTTQNTCTGDPKCYWQ